jgi:hypothetical protein
VVTQILTTVVTLPFVPAPTGSSNNGQTSNNGQNSNNGQIPDNGQVSDNDNSPITAAPIINKPTGPIRNTQIAPISVTGNSQGSDANNETPAAGLVRTLVLAVGESTTLTIATNGPQETQSSGGSTTVITTTTANGSQTDPQVNQPTRSSIVPQQSTISAEV